MFRLALIPLFVLLLLLSGCTIPTYTYIRNTSEMPVHVSIKSTKYPPYIKLGSTNGKLKYNAFKTFTDSVPVLKQNEEEAVFDIPARQTAFIIRTINFSGQATSLKVDGVELLDEHRVYKQELFKRSEGGRGSVVLLYEPDVK